MAEPTCSLVPQRGGKRCASKAELVRVDSMCGNWTVKTLATLSNPRGGRNMVYCSKCGALNADGAKYCNNCATALPLTTQGAPPQQSSFQQAEQASAPLPPQLQPGQKATLLDYLSHYQGLQYHWVRRFVAIVFDAIFVMVPVYVFLVFATWMFGGFFGYIGLGGIILFLYSALFEFSFGATLGKMIMGLKVVSTQGKLEFPNALIRNITKIYALLLIIEFIVTLVVETTDAHQRYLDKLARTTVIEKR